MQITKFGHSCLLVEEADARILTDPGIWNPVPEVEGVDAILITHEHQDHCDVAQLQAILTKNPSARVITHAAVAKILRDAGIPSETINPGQPVMVNGVSVESFGTEHAVIYGASPCRNTGYLIAGKLFAPGDALHDVPGKAVEVLALPTGGPWMKISEAIDYAKKIQPKAVFPIHDAMYTDEYARAVGSRWIGGTLAGEDIAFRDLSPGSTAEF